MGPPTPGGPSSSRHPQSGSSWKKLQWEDKFPVFSQQFQFQWLPAIILRLTMFHWP